jgi:hypothetical protein
VSNALHERRGLDQAETLAQIQKVFNSELDSPTEDVTGKFV